MNEELNEIVKAALNAGQVIGVRNGEEDEQYSVGDAPRNSYVWDFENDMSTYDNDEVETEEYDYTCTTGTKGVDWGWSDADNADDVAAIVEALKIAIKDNQSYYSHNQYLIAGVEADGDGVEGFENDPDELDITDGTVVMVIKQDAI